LGLGERFTRTGGLEGPALDDLAHGVAGIDLDPVIGIGSVGFLNRILGLPGSECEK
jgi:hypothetical protein